MAAIGHWIDRNCHVVYVVVAVPLVIWFACRIPAFQSPDEPAHFSRADQVSHGGLVGTRFGATDSGGWIDAAIPLAYVPYSRIPFNPAAKLTSGEIEVSRQIRWSGRPRLSGFRNTVNYGPLFYLPQAAGIWIGRGIGLGVVDSLVVARIANALACCALAFVALRTCTFGKRVMFSVLCWPMTLALSASSSHDGLLIASAVLMIAIASRVSTENRSATTLELTVFLIALVGGVTGRPPHIAFAALLPLLFRRSTAGASPLTWRIRIALLFSAVLCVGWIVLVQTYTMSVTLLDVPEAVDGGPSISGQIAYLTANPGAIPAIVHRTIVLGWKPLMVSAIGVLGWLDTLMPSWYYWLATAGFAAALAADRPVGLLSVRGVALGGWASLVAFTALTYISIYLTWMGVGAPDVLGVQGRYLLAGLPLVAWLLPAAHATTPAVDRTIGAGAWIAAVLFVAITYAVVPSHVVARYYAP